MEQRTVVREANALDLEPITQLTLKLVEAGDLADSETEALKQRIYDDLTRPSPSSYWIAFVNEVPSGTIKVTALGPGFETLIALEWLATESDDVARRLVAASLGDDIPVQTWIYDDAGAARVEKLGFVVSDVAADAPEASLVPGRLARKAIRR